MAKTISPRVPAISAPSGVQDQAARQILQLLVDAHNARNGDTDSRFVTYRELASMVEALSSQQTTTTTSSTDNDDAIQSLSSDVGSIKNALAVLNGHSTTDGYDVGNVPGNVPHNNGALNENLNADMLDGKHASEFVPLDAAVTATKSATGKYMPITIGGVVYYLPLFQ